MKIFKSFLFIFFCVTACFAQTPPKHAFFVLDNISVGHTVYSVHSKLEKDYFLLKLCNNDTCFTSKSYAKKISPQLLTTDIIDLVKNKLDKNLVVSSVTQTEKDAIAQLVKKAELKDIEKIRNERNDLENILNDIDNEKHQYSAKIVLNKYVPYSIKYSETSRKEPGAKNDTSKPAKKAIKGTGTLEIIDAKIHFFNNKASSIYVKAKLISNGKAEKLIFLNNRYSVPLRYFNNYGSIVSTKDANRNDIIVDYNDIFDYESDQFFNYSVANSQISLSCEKGGKAESQVIQRRFLDFFTGIIYSDVMGFNTENSNSILNAQVKLLLPLNLKNWGKLTLTRQFITSSNIALNNSFEDETRFIAIKDNETFSSFDLLKKNNLYGKIGLDALTYESKGWFLNTSLGYSVAFYRTGFRYTQTQDGAEDIVTNQQLLSLGHGPYLNFEIRPQTNFGADIAVSLEDLNYNGMQTINNRSFNNDIIVDTQENHFITRYNMVNVEANFYWLTNPDKSKGGIYAKLGTYYHTDNHTIFPQIMVGYATNLTSFVNRFKPKKKTPEIKEK